MATKGLIRRTQGWRPFLREDAEKLDLPDNSLEEVGVARAGRAVERLRALPAVMENPEAQRLAEEIWDGLLGVARAGRAAERLEKLTSLEGDEGIEARRLAGEVAVALLELTRVRQRLVAEHWIEVRLDQWVAAYRLVPKDGVLVTSEVRVFPYEPGRDRPPGRWSAEALGDDVAGSVPDDGLPTKLLRQLNPLKHRAHLKRLLEQSLPALEKARQAREREFEEAVRLLFPSATRLPKPEATDQGDKAFAPYGLTRRSLARPNTAGVWTDERLAVLAEDYARHYRMGHEPWDFVAYDWEGWARQTLKQQLVKARRRGLLTSTGSGAKGGSLTTAAQEILARLSPDDKASLRAQPTRRGGKR